MACVMYHLLGAKVKKKYGKPFQNKCDYNKNYWHDVAWHGKNYENKTFISYGLIPLWKGKTNNFDYCIQYTIYNTQ